MKKWKDLFKRTPKTEEYVYTPSVPETDEEKNARALAHDQVIYARHQCVLVYQSPDLYTKQYDTIQIWDSTTVTRSETKQGVVDLYQEEYIH